MSVEHARRQLGVNDRDFDSIKKAKDSSRFLLVLLGAIFGVASFITGYAVGRAIDPGYPFSSISAATVAGAGRRRAPWVIVLLVAVLAVFSFDLGTLAAHSTYGEGSYYGVFGRRR